MFGAKVHRTLYLLLLTLLGCSMVTSRGLSNFAWVALLVNWAIEGRWREKWQMARESCLLQAFGVLLLAYGASMLWMGEPLRVLNALEIRMAIFAVPLVVLTTPPIEFPHSLRSALRSPLTYYVTTVFVCTVIGAVRMLVIPDLPYREAFPFCSNIRFALNCCLVIVLITTTHHPLPTTHYPLKFLLVLWLLAYLVLIRSYTGFAVLTVVSLVMILCYRRHWKWIGLWLAVVGGIGVAIGIGVHNYYRLVPQATEPLAAVTANGRPYVHRQDGFVESGNYVHNYLCTEEYRAEWARRSHASLDSVGANGYTLTPTLVRYLNALGLPKDSLGVASLTPDQVADIERGIPTPAYKAWFGRRMLHVMLFEYESGRRFHAVGGFTMLQRFELWRATLRTIRHNPWLGSGVVHMRDVMDAEEEAMDASPSIAGLYPHNQYLSWLATFGIVGLLLVLAAFLRAAPALRRQAPWMVGWLVIILVSFLTEDTLGDLTGRLFCTWFLAFRQTADS